VTQRNGNIGIILYLYYNSTEMYMCIKGIEFAYLYDSAIDFGNVRTVWYFFVFHLNDLKLNVCVSNCSFDKIYFHCKQASPFNEKIVVKQVFSTYE
jgi:hypothetical protein